MSRLDPLKGTPEKFGSDALSFAEDDREYTFQHFKREDGATIEFMFRGGFLHLVTVIEQDGFFLEIEPDAVNPDVLEAGLGYRPKMS